MITAGFRWDPSAQAVLTDALARIGPSRCVVEFHPDELVLTEMSFGGRRNRTGSLLECGAALSTAWTVLRVLGQEPAAVFPENREHPDVVAVVRLDGQRVPGSGEWARYAALRKLAHPVDALTPVSAAMLGALVSDNFWPDTAVRPVRPEWVPALRGLGAELTGQSPLLVLTPQDTRRHHVLAGAALHGTRLAAAVRGLATQVVSPLTLPPSERTRLLDAARLPGVLQAVIRVGLPKTNRKRS